MTEDILRIAHETDLLATVRQVKEHRDFNDQPSELFQEKVEDQIRKRERIINGLKKEIEELKSLSKQNEATK